MSKLFSSARGRASGQGDLPMGVVLQPVTPELRRWIVQQAEAGCTDDSLISAMTASGWHPDVARSALRQVLAGQAATRPLPAPAEGPPPVATGKAVEGMDSVALPEPPLEDGASVLWVDGHRIDVMASVRKPRVVVFNNLLTTEECEGLMAAARERLERSMTVDNSTGGSEVNSARTSDGMFFERGESALIQRVEQRIATLLRWPVERGEGIQVLRYRPGAQYKPHYDYFDPDQPGSPTILKRGGQRVATLVMYLHAPQRGGATTFPDAGIEVGPVRGSAVFFSYAAPKPDTLTLHGGAPVLEGEKWVATKWLRQGRFE